MNYWLRQLFIPIFGIFIITSCASEGTPTSKNLTPKYKILVDKVMQKYERGRVKEWIIEATADAGFTAYSPRWGYENLEEVKLIANWCEKYKIDYMPWMRGTVSVEKSQNSDGRKVVWANGSEQALWSPNSDEFWDWMKSYVVEYAKISSENPRLIGVFLDFENYASGYGKNGYDLSYDDIIMGKFAKIKGVQIPDLKLDERKSWLESKNLHKDFSNFQINFWRERCRELRNAVDFYNPKFKFCIYPAPGTLFVLEAIYPELATTKAPLILADASGYGRPWRFSTESEALKENRQDLIKGMQVPQKIKIPHIYLGGIDPVSSGADPEFSGKNAVMMSEVSDGYWVFYEGPSYTNKEHGEYMNWFKWANKKIDSGDFKAQHESRKTLQNEDLFAEVNNLSWIKLPEFSGKTSYYPTVRLRGENLLFIAAKAGVAVEISVQHHPIGKYKTPIGWELRSPNKSYVDSGFIAYNKFGVIKFIPKVDGPYILGISADACAYSFKSSNAPLGLYAAKSLWLHGGAERLYFKVPEKIQEFKIDIKGRGSRETVRVDVFNTKEELVATGQTRAGRQEVQITVPAYDRKVSPWSLSVTKADQGRLEDNYINLDPLLPAILSFKPEEVFDRYLQQ